MIGYSILLQLGLVLSPLLILERAGLIALNVSNLLLCLLNQKDGC